MFRWLLITPLAYLAAPYPGVLGTNGVTVTATTASGDTTISLSNVPDSVMATSYSGTGACQQGQFVSTLNDAAAPTCGTPAGAGAACVSYSLWGPCAENGVTNCTIVGDGCVATTNVGAVGQKGAIVVVDFDKWTHCVLRYRGALAASQTGTVTAKLSEYDGVDSDLITTSFNSGTTCTDRSSSVTDLSAQTGKLAVGLQLGDSTVGDDPIFSSVVLTCCDATFTW